jgi:hypothetical protein
MQPKQYKKIKNSLYKSFLNWHIDYTNDEYSYGDEDT